MQTHQAQQLANNLLELSMHLLGNLRKYLTTSNLFLAWLGSLNIFAILAPILTSLGAVLPAKVIYFIYSFFCHQISWRSVYMADHQCAWCSRCMGMWGGAFTGALLVRLFKFKGIKWYQILPFAIPIALDGGIQTIASTIGLVNGGTAYVSTNLMRGLTGSLFGIGLGLVIMPILMETDNFLNFKEKLQLFGERIKLNTLQAVMLSMTILGIVYVALVGAWNISSPNNKPSNFLDSQIKMPSKEFELERRKDGICPVSLNAESTDITDAFALDCFFGSKN